jgi:hypothetical protein
VCDICKEKPPAANTSGPDRTRTDGLCDANAALSQLSYGPARILPGGPDLSPCGSGPLPATTSPPRGQPAGADLQMIADLGFEVEGATEATLPRDRAEVSLRRRGAGTEVPANS